MERLVHFHGNGTVTARLEITVAGSEVTAEGAGGEATKEGGRHACRALAAGSVGGFIDRHIARVKESFEGEIADAADAEYERFAAAGRAYRYRPCILRVDYGTVRRGRKAEVTVRISASAGRRTLSLCEERHTFGRVLGEELYRGAK